MANERKIQKGLKDVSHLFLSSLEGGEGRIAFRDISPAQQQQFLKRCKFRATFILDPSLERREVAFHSALVRNCSEEYARTWFMVDSPSDQMWSEFSTRYTLPDYQEIKEATCRTYPVDTKNNLVVLGSEYFKQLPGQSRIREREVLSHFQPELFWFMLTKRSPQSFPDFVPFLDELMFVVSPHVEEISEAYKIVKACLSMTPDLSFSILLNSAEKSEKKREEMRTAFDRELNAITTRFLHLRIPVVGPFDCNAMAENDNDQIQVQDLFSFYRVQNWKRWQEKMTFVSRLFDFIREKNTHAN